ncbi:Dcp1p-Dcp2p decapping enzyme complex alpha subunit [Puccinia graminis f. sp. tritici]|uniref:Dcp1p-Dcp2p decapping enzyme complex alpha subunit n=1 Tax=Puccinia graminis f. sp. tritici TaxID=56615 RepID=A0A5B0S9Y2_PUCGR|nr:Dcp1p-Dcp2p decapping enzyme complex alpha subunit [Puccinia graminis f. sp. tritici]
MSNWFGLNQEKERNKREEDINRKTEVLQGKSKENDIDIDSNSPTSPKSSSDTSSSDIEQKTRMSGDQTNHHEQSLTTDEAKQLFIDMRTEIAKLRLNVESLRQTPVAAPVPPTPPQTTDQSLKDILLRNFVRSPLSAHKEINPRKPILDYDGVQFQVWHDALDRTLMHFFMKDKSFLEEPANFDGLLLTENSLIASVIRNTIEDQLVGIVEGSKLKAPLELYNLLKNNCSKSDRRHKIELVDKLMALVTDPSPSDGFTLSKWATVIAELDQLKIEWPEVSGLLLQTAFKPPIGVDTKTFEFSVDQQLDAKDKPAFADVSSVIQSATGKLKSKVSSNGPVPMDLDRIQAMNSNKAYVAPQRRHPPQHQSTDRQHPKVSIDKATHYKGKGQSEALLNKYGHSCVYCKKEGHWYSDCPSFWKDVATKKIASPPDNYASTESHYQPPRQPENDRLRQVNIPNVTEGCLLDSGASAHDAYCQMAGS